jgi:uncharacterized protein
MSKDRMRYDLLVQDALRSVVKAALIRVSKEGLPGNHHFFITFRTDADGVDISPALRSEYPEEMTIVLQHQYWGLTIDDEGFSVGLSFNKTPQTLRIPFHALVQFHDPAVQFQLPFQPRAQTGAVVAPRPRDVPSIEKSEPARVQRIERAERPKTEKVERAEKPQTPEPKKPDDGGAVVSLDSFRKK